MSQLPSVIVTSQLPGWMEWIQAITVSIGGLIASITLIIYYREYRKNREEYKKTNLRMRAERAVEIAKLFADTFIPMFDEYKMMCNKRMSCRMTIREKIKHKEQLSFDKIEASELISPSLIKAFSDSEALMTKEEPGYEKLTCSIVNHLEWICMNFRYNIAQEDTVYQSLQESLIMTLQYMYMDIALANDSPESMGPEKLFTNCIYVYNLWNKRKSENLKKHRQRIIEGAKKAQDIVRAGVTEGPKLD